MKDWIKKTYAYRYWIAALAAALLGLDSYVILDFKAGENGFTAGALVYVWLIKLLYYIGIIGAIAFTASLLLRKDKQQKGVTIFVCFALVISLLDTAMRAYTTYVVMPKAVGVLGPSNTPAVGDDADLFKRFGVEPPHPAETSGDFDSFIPQAASAQPPQADALLKMSEDMAEVASQRKYRTQDYAFSSTLLIESAQKGNPEAQYRLGYMYMVGYIFPENKKRAIYWLEKAGAQKYPKALPLLAELTSSQSLLERISRALTY